jgi:hypothetical protein
MTEFRHRGDTPSRLEGLSDAVFGFSLTLLVVSLEVPQTFTELRALAIGFVPFSLCFMLFMHTWYLHHRFFRRYGLRDVPMIWLNSTLLFLVMFFVYPLKFLASFLVRVFTGDPMTIAGPEGIPIPILAWEDAVESHLLFSVGFVAVHVIFLLMHLRAWREREGLDLNHHERFDTRTAMREHGIFILIGTLSSLVALAGGARWIPVAGWTYAALGPIMGLHGYISGKRRAALSIADEG